MTKFNTRKKTPTKATRGRAPIQSYADPNATTYEGAPGFARDAKSELFLLGVANFASEDTFYEGGSERDARFKELVQKVAVEDGPWFAQFVRWMRAEANMRSAPMIAAVEGVKARLAVGIGQTTLDVIRTAKPSDVGRVTGVDQIMGDGVTNRQLIASVLQRADEPGELLAYVDQQFGRAFPMPVKRGVADAVLRLYHERSLLKWDSDSAAFRFGDVIEMVHPTPDSEQQSSLFRYAIDRGKKRDEIEIPESLKILRARTELMKIPVELRRQLLVSDLGPITLANAGMTWEAVAGWLQGPMDGKAWEAIIPSMGYMALLRNLRNFQEAGIAQQALDNVLAKLGNPEEVAKSRQFPFRFMSAYKEVQGNLKVSAVLEQAINHSLVNVPELPGRTLILVDTSGSMYYPAGGKMSKLQRAEAAALFGAALALRAEDATLVSFGTASGEHIFRKGDSLLPLAQQITATSRGGTNTAEAVRHHFGNHDRVVIITDEQAWGGYFGANPTDVVPANVPVYTWNLGGYKYGHAESGGRGRYTFGGLTDQAFRMVPLLEAGANATWPWEKQS